MRNFLLFALLFVLPQAHGTLTPLNGGTPEGTAVKSTGAAMGLVLTAQGDGTSAWNSVAGTGDVVGPASSVDSQFALFNSTTGKLIKAATGTGVCKAVSGVASFATLVNADVSASAAIAFSKMAALTASRVAVTDASGFVVAGTQTVTELALLSSATNANTASTLVKRDGSGNFSAGTITANLTGNASGTAATFTGSLTGPVTSTAMATSIIESYTGMIAAAADGTYTIDLYPAFAGTINTLKIITDSGTTTAAVKIAGTNVTGISAVSVSSTIATGTASAANTFAVGDKITLVLSSSSSPVNLAFTLKYTR